MDSDLAALCALSFIWPDLVGLPSILREGDRIGHERSLQAAKQPLRSKLP
jgi:hypothetical protein